MAKKNMFYKNDLNGLLLSLDLVSAVLSGSGLVYLNKLESMGKSFNKNSKSLKAA